MKIVSVNPKKPFLLTGWSDGPIASLDAVEKELRESAKLEERTREVAQEMVTALGGGILDPIEAAAMCLGTWLKKRPAIEVALGVHQARQERRKTHFEQSCRKAGCPNLHRFYRAPRGSGRTHRPRLAALFCREHRYLRGELTGEQLSALLASSSNRVA